MRVRNYQDLLRYGEGLTVKRRCWYPTHIDTQPERHSRTTTRYSTGARCICGHRMHCYHLLQMLHLQLHLLLLKLSRVVHEKGRLVLSAISVYATADLDAIEDGNSWTLEGTRRAATVDIGRVSRGNFGGGSARGTGKRGMKWDGGVGGVGIFDLTVRVRLLNERETRRGDLLGSLRGVGDGG